MNETLEIDRPADTTEIEIPANPHGLNAIDSSADVPTTESPEWVKQAANILAELPTYLTQVYKDNQSIVIALGLVFAAIVAVKLALAILGAIEGIPLLAPTFQLVGIGYTTWFVWRYLLQASTREELNSEIDDLKSEIFGNYDRN